jgi:thiol-disulfide isomerase/thioredoxin
MTLNFLNRPVQAGLIVLMSASVFAGPACAQKKGGASGTVPARSAGQGAATAGSPAGAHVAPLWAEATGYELYVGPDKDAHARVFRSPDYQKLLVLPGSGETAFILALKEKELSAVPRRGLTVTDAGVRLTSGVAPRPTGGLVQQGSDVLFKSGKVDMKLAPEPELIGEITLADLLKKKPEYAEAAAAYRPGAAALGLIRNVQRPVEIVVFFGTWCSYCKEQVPRFIKTIQAAANPRIKARFVGIDEELTRPGELLEEYNISRTPTFTVRVGGEEIGRISEQPEKTMEDDLALILLGRR